MKKIILIAFSLITLSFTACKNEPNSSAVKKEVLNIHDQLMIDGEKVVKNRIKLDSILQTVKIKSPNDTLKLVTLISKLNKADEGMMDWMHFFKDNFKGQNEQEDLAYYKSEMLKIRAVEDQYIKATKESDSVLATYNVLPVKRTESKHHQH